jgi:DNA-binding transcriptional ArsR family regulator
MANYYQKIERQFHALGDPTRLAIIMRLCDQGHLPVGDVAKPFEMKLPSLMKHLAILEASELIVTKKSGRVRTCHLRADTIRSLSEWFTDRRALWEQRLDQLEAFLEEPDPTPWKGETS